MIRGCFNELDKKMASNCNNRDYRRCSRCLGDDCNLHGSGGPLRVSFVVILIALLSL